MLDQHENNQDIKVSVCVVTYNHKNYIRECLDSLINQSASFKYEIIVGDDASTDETSDIVSEYASRYPGLIIPVLHQKNLGAARNYFSVHDLARGKYICHMDGDDLALPGKLQRSSEILDREHDVNIVFHRMKMRSAKTKNEINDLLDTNIIGKNRFSRSDLLTIGSIACHSSKMYRRENKFIDKTNSDVLDYFTDIIQVGSGFAYLINDFLGVYHVGVGITQSGKTKKIYLNHLEYFLKTYPQYSAEIGANALTCFLVDLKNGRDTWRTGFRIWLQCLSVKSIPIFIKTLPLRKIFRTPSPD